MNKKTAMKVSLLAPLMCVVLAMSASVQAQPGKRLCGKMAALPNGAGYAAILVEVKNKVAYYSGCSVGVDADPAAVFANNADVAPYLASMAWSNIVNGVCESVGANFTSADHTNVDMCDYMEGQAKYAVVKKSATNSTTYTRW